jgi:hypothetical protein
VGYIVNLLSGGGFILYNRAVAKKLGVNAAILIGYLCRMVEVFKNSFYRQQEVIADETALSVYEVRAATKRLQDAGLIRMVLEGLPAKNKYTVMENELEAFLRSALSCENFAQLDAKEFDTKTSSDIASNTTTHKEDRSIGDTGVTENEVTRDTERVRARARKQFVPPTVEEVAAYCRERGNKIDAEAFVAHYEIAGWRYGKAQIPMQSWKAAVITWEKGDKRRAELAAPASPKRLESYDDYFKHHR